MSGDLGGSAGGGRPGRGALRRRDAGFARAVEHFLQAERQAVDEEIEVMTGYGPFRRTEMEEQD